MSAPPPTRPLSWLRAVVPLLLVVLLSPLLASPAAGHGEAAKVGAAYGMAPLLQVPFEEGLALQHGLVAPGGWPPYAAHDLAHETMGQPASLRLAHNGTALFIQLSYPGRGWAAVGWSELGKGPAQVLEAVPSDDGANVTFVDAFAENLTSEVVNAPDTELGGRDNILASAWAPNGTGAIASFAFPLDSGDDRDPGLEVGELHTFLLAFNATSKERPETLDEGTEVFLRVFLDRPADSSAELHDLFASSPSPWPSIAALGPLAAGVVWLWGTLLRRPRP